jgi:pantetheine-phosphate adenylyltransferase
VVRRATQLFATVIVAVAAGHHKKTLFSLEERMAMVREAVAPIPAGQRRELFGPGARLCRGAWRHGHGARLARRDRFRLRIPARRHEPRADARGGNRVPHPSDKYQFISSTFVREIAVLGGEVEKFVSPGVLARLAQKVQEQKNLQRP